MQCVRSWVGCAVYPASAVRLSAASRSGFRYYRLRSCECLFGYVLCGLCRKMFTATRNPRVICGYSNTEMDYNTTRTHWPFKAPHLATTTYFVYFFAKSHISPPSLKRIYHMYISFPVYEH